MRRGVEVAEWEGVRGRVGVAAGEGDGKGGSEKEGEGKKVRERVRRKGRVKDGG